MTRECGLSAFSWVCCFLHVVQVQPNMPQGTIFCCGVAQHDWTEPQVTQKKNFMNQPLQSLLNFSLRYLFYQTTFATGTIIKNTSVPAGVLPEGIKEFKKMYESNPKHVFNLVCSVPVSVCMYMYVSHKYIHYKKFMIVVTVIPLISDKAKLGFI